MRWSEALQDAPRPPQPDLPVTIIHRSGSYQEIYSTYTYIYPAGSGTAYRTAGTSVVRHILNEFGLNDDGWYVPSVPQHEHCTWLTWMTQVFHFLTRRKKRSILQRDKNSGRSANGVQA